jgi:tetratricopeptide (TPR) repeat protein
VPRPALVVILLAALLTGAACNRNDVGPPEVSPIDAKEAEAFVHDLTDALEPCDAERLQAVIDTDALGRLVLEGVEVPAPSRRSFLKGFTDAPKLGKQLCGSGENLNRFHLLRMRGDGAAVGTRPLYRVVGANGFNYLELELARSKRDGKVRVIDAYSFTSGERISDTQRGIARALFYTSTARAGAVAEFQEVQALAAAGENAKAHERLGKLPPRLRENRAMLLLDVKLSVPLDEATYLAAIAAYEKAFPGDASVDLVSIDRHYMRKDWNRLIASIDRLDRSVGGDPYLTSLRAAAYYGAGKFDEALQQSTRYITAEPEEMDGWWTLLSIRLARDELDEALAVLERLHETFAITVNPAVMAQEPAYARLLASPQWERWKQAHPAAIQAQDVDAAPAEAATR